MRSFLPASITKAAWALLMAIACAPPAHAADSNGIAVSVTVPPMCKFNVATSTLNFTLNAASTANATASTSVTYWCTKGTAATVSTGAGLYPSAGMGRMRHSTILTSFIPYSLGLVGGTQTGGGKSVPLTLTINGTVLNAAYINSDVGTYSDTVSVTISP